MYRISEIRNHLISNGIRVDMITIIKLWREEADKMRDLDVNLMRELLDS